MALGTASATAPYEMRFDAGRICLDLLSTAHPVERLDSLAALGTWITGSGLVPPGTPLTRADASWLTGFRELRSHVRRLVRRAVTGPAESDGNRAGNRPYDIALARVNDIARVAPPAPRAVQQRDGTLVRELDGSPECHALLAVIARDAVDLLTDPVARACIRQCEGEACPIVYVDTSRGRRRRWCSSEVCGNRERVARHRRRAALARA
ncbi:CGNR zinc finger domain-containing protein [Streptomyces sp. NPDC047000]|uniref:CGNR zinc finger domain-containing protein n=1 Tax=Streptomyces sp. NPDC047000 TaxID=3155474 RepID=UPI0033E97347